MPRAQLRQRIDELVEELERTESLDAGARDRLAAVIAEIRDALAEERAAEGEEEESLLDRLNEATHHFEESHPTLTALINRVAESLSNLGI